ncbi:MAG: energy transducer TonB [Xanthomonadales bacterium]|nr:energy transducer TonB [Xanthomonadales bacterium]
MLKLLGNSPKLINTDSFDLSISYVKAEVDTKEKKRQKKKPPEPEKTTQPPSVPKLNIAQSNHAELNIPTAYSQAKSLNLLSKTSIPGFNFHLGSPKVGSQGGIKAGIPPVYPPKALLNNTEGWVQVLIEINERGSVSQVSVLDAEPARLFEEAAIKAVRKWSFYPKKENGVAVPYQLIQIIEFKIDPMSD